MPAEASQGTEKDFDWETRALAAIHAELLGDHTLAANLLHEIQEDLGHGVAGVRRS